MKTPEEIAREVWEGRKVGADLDHIIDRIAAAIREARTQALEQAAKIADSRSDNAYFYSAIGDAIRERIAKERA